MLNHIKRLITVLFFAAICIGCRKDGIDKENEHQYTFRLTIPQNQVPYASTYAMSSDDENKADTIELLSFYEDASNHFVYSNHLNITTKTQTQTQITFTASLKNRLERQKFMVLINGQQTINTASPQIGEEMNAVINKLNLSCPTEWPAKNPNNNIRYIPMYGCSAPAVLNSPNSVIDIEAVRSLACISIKSPLPLSQLEIVEAYLFNRPTTGNIAFPETNWDPNTGSVISPFIATGNTNKIKISTNAYKTTAAQEILQSIYCLEANKPADKASATAIILGAKYHSSSTITYYRIDIPEFDKSGQSKPNTMGAILRNHHYIININGASAAGASLPALAFNGDINLTASITDWIPVIQDITLNAQHTLALSTRNVTLDGKNQNDLKTIIISTDQDQSAPTINPGNNSSWINSRIKQIADDLAGHKRYSLQVSAKTANPGSQPRNTTLNVSFLNFTCSVFIEQSPASSIVYTQKNTANCYILQAGTSQGIKIPMNSYLNGVTNVGTELLWTDNPHGLNANGAIQSINITGQGTNMTLDVAPGKEEGNAVIIIKDKTTGNILWSWHIWVLNQMPQDLKSTAGKGITMDRNLGALSNDITKPESHGLLYQWGRKDPFPTIEHSNWIPLYDASGNLTGRPKIEPVTLSNNLDNAIKNPYTYYKGFGSINDWYCQASYYTQYPQGDHLWSTNNQTYNPCPEGYTIPGDDHFTDLIAANITQKGDIDGDLGNRSEPGIKYPRTEYMNNGTFKNDQLVYWTINVNSGKSNVLKVANGGLNFGQDMGRDCALPVRCIRK